jgi:hypothetical protein
VNAPRGLGLGPHGRRSWRDAVAALEARGVVPAPGTLERYCRSVDRLAAVEAAWVELGRPTTSEGSMRQAVPHPLLRELRSEAAACQKLAEALMPTAQAGWPRGKARSPDRAARGPSRRRAEVIKLMPPSVRDALGDG